MVTRHVTGLCLAVALSWSIGAAAQGTTGTQDAGQGTDHAVQTDMGITGAQDERSQAEQQRSDVTRSGGKRHMEGQTVTVTGCVQPERDVFATRGIFNDDVVLTNASAVNGDITAFDRPHETGDHRAAATADVGPYDADQDDLRGETIVQHDGTQAGAVGAVGTTGESAAAESEARDEPRSATGIAADRPTGEDDADREGDQRAEAAPGTTAAHGDRYSKDPEQRTTGTSGHAGQFSATHGRVIDLTGDKESELQQLVGRKVEVTGTVSYDEQAVASAATGPGTELRTDRPEEGQARATNTGGGWQNPDEVDAAHGRARLAAKPQLEIASFRDMGACEAGNRPQ
jgi:hypothetical protein